MPNRRMSRIVKVSLTTTATMVVPPSVERVSLRFFTPSSSISWWSPNSDLEIGAGIQGSSSMIPIQIERDGDVVKQGWFGLLSAGTGTGSYMETIEMDGE